MPRSPGDCHSPPHHPLQHNSAFTLLHTSPNISPPPVITPTLGNIPNINSLRAADLNNLRAAAAAMMYGNPLSPLVPVTYPPGAGYVWPPFAGLFLPYSTSLHVGRPPEIASPERGSTASERGYTPPEKAKIGKHYHHPKLNIT